MKRLNIYIVLALLMLSVGKSYASQTAKNDSVIDVPRFLIASWFRGIDKEPFDNSTWYRNTSFTFNVNPELMWDRARYDHNLFNFGFSLNKDFTSSSSLSLGLSFANSDNRDYKFRRIGSEIGYLWNITNFYYGLDRERRYSVAATTGLEAGYIKDFSTDNSKLYYGGYLGMRLSRVFTPHTSLFVEPRIGIYSDSYDASVNPEGFDAMLTAHIGLNYKLSEMLYLVPLRKEIKPLHMKNWYFELGADAMLPVPKYDYVSEDSKYVDHIDFGTSIGIGYRVNPLTLARGRFTFSDNRYDNIKQYLGALDLLLSGTNIFLGENERRYVDMSLVVGPLFQIGKISGHEKLHYSWGAEAGLQFTRRIKPNWEIFLEPRYQLIQDYTKIQDVDSRLKQRWDMNLGMIYVYQKHYRPKRTTLPPLQRLYIKSILRPYQSIREWHPFEEWHLGNNLRNLLPKHKEHVHSSHVPYYDYSHPMQKWYIQTTWDAQLSSLTTGHQIGSFDFAVGRKLNNLFSVQASVFSGELLSEEPDFNDSYNPMFVSYYGGRADFVFNFLQLLSPVIKESRWNWNISTGVEMGHLTNHHTKDVALVATSQLQYRLGRRAWLTAGGRLQLLKDFDVKLPLSGLLGIQYDFNNARRVDIMQNKWRWYIQTNSGFHRSFFNMDNLAYGGAFGLNITPNHGLRIEYLTKEKNRGTDGTYYNWMSLSPEYVFNLTNKLLGEDDKRRVDIELFTGADIMLHSSSVFDSRTRLGINLGTQINANISNSISLFIQPRFSIQTGDKILAPTSHDKVQYFTLFGIRYSHNRFKSLKN